MLQRSGLSAPEGYIALAGDEEPLARPMDGRGRSIAYRDAGPDRVAHAAAALRALGVVTSLLTEALVARGVDVTLFATRDRMTRGKLAGVCPAPYAEDRPSMPRSGAARTSRMSSSVQGSSISSTIRPTSCRSPSPGWCETPVVTTIHGFSSDRIVPGLQGVSRSGRYVAISGPTADPICAMPRRSITASRWRRSPSIPTAAKTFCSSAASTLTRARRRRSKRPAGRGRRLVMAGIVQDHGYYEDAVQPAVDGMAVVYRGALGGTDRVHQLGSAHALLHLIAFDEPFGLSVVEALACGTPVIATNRGSMPELIDHGVTGFLVDSLDDAVDAIGRVGEIDRAACRAAVAARFTVDHMADRYLALYRSLLG